LSAKIWIQRNSATTKGAFSLCASTLKNGVEARFVAQRASVRRNRPTCVMINYHRVPTK